MAGSPSATTFQRPDLGQTFSEFELDAARLGFIGTQVLPVFSTPLRTSNFSKLPVEQLLIDRETARAPGSGYRRQDWQFEQDNYATIEHGAEESVDDRERQMYRYSFDMERVAASRVRSVVVRRLERSIAAAVFNTSTWTGASLTTTVGTKWSDVAGSAPISDVRAAAIKVRDGTGFKANSLICDWEVLQYLKDNAQILDRIKYAGYDDVKKRNITADMIAAALGLDRILVSEGVRNSADKGQSLTAAKIWVTDKVMICRIAETQDLLEPCVGRTFVWTGDGASAEATMEEYREEQTRSQIIRARTDYHEKILYAAAGHLLTNITA